MVDRVKENNTIISHCKLFGLMNSLKYIFRYKFKDAGALCSMQCLETEYFTAEYLFFVEPTGL